MTAERPDAVEPNTGLLLFYPYRALESRVLTALAEAGFEITLAQARLLQRVADDGSRLTDLAAQAQVTKQTAGELVDQLQRRRYVERVPDPSDGRARLIRLAARGREAAALAAPVVATVEAEWATHLGPESMTALRAALTRLREITDPWA
ncbi:MarR family transcriptional regulator [Modestobacter caceresii]|uniref:MarR family transcriptional regulator n=1 Tax=Modestobacter caceresii TaxID=1522368 RepID=A0A098Y4N2_9ACTN|nr:MarR family winged helix-turn-helix transcriptional regulator [Modestobacter caceresii]KGH45459.1 MarR family transcriptional regulator [Modestobacter caceresii]